MTDDPKHGGKDLREMLRGGSEFRKLKVPYYIKAGSTVRAFNPDAATWDACEPIKRPLVMGEKVVTTGLMNEIRIGDVVLISSDGKRATVDDGACYLFLSFDKDDDHEWTMGHYGLKSVVDQNGNFVK